MQTFHMYKVMALVLLLCSELGTPQSAPFLVQREHIPATLSEAAHEELLRNGLHAEIVGEVAERKTECGIVLMDYTGYVDGEVFEMAIRSVEDELQATSNSTFLNETLRYKVYTEMKAKILAEHKIGMKTLFDERRASVPLYRPTGLLSSYAGILTLGLGIGLGGLIFKGLESLIGQGKIDVLQTRVSEEWNTIMSIITQISNTMTLETSSLRFGIAFYSVKDKIHAMVHDMLDQLFSFDRVTSVLMQSSSNHSIQSAIQQFMGERFHNTLLKTYGKVARNVIKATVLGMNHKVMEVEVCYPTTALSDVHYLLHVEPLGQFSKNMSSFSTSNVGGLYAMGKGQTSLELHSLRKVQEESLCHRVSSVKLCNLQTQTSGCSLLAANRQDCASVTYNSTSEKFLLVRPLTRSVVIATRAKEMFWAPEYTTTEWQSLDIRAPVFAVKIPKGKMLMIGSTHIRARVVDGTLSTNITVIIPDSTPQLPPGANPSHMETVSWTRSFISVESLLCAMLIGLLSLIIMGALVVIRYEKKCRMLERRTDDTLQWRHYVDMYRLPVSTAPPFNGNCNA